MVTKWEEVFYLGREAFKKITGNSLVFYQLGGGGHSDLEWVIMGTIWILAIFCFGNAVQSSIELSAIKSD